MRVKLFSLLLSLILLCCSPVICFAANSDFLTESKWVTAKGVKSQIISSETVNSNISGKALYIKDNENLVLYTNFTFSESSMNFDGYDDISINYECETKEGIYTFSIDENGIVDEFGESQNVFDVGQNIYIDATSATLLSYIQYTGQSTVTKTRVFLSINGKRYLILDRIKLKIPEKTTVKKEKTTKKKSSSGRVKIKTYSNNSVRTKTTAEKTSKFDMTFPDETKVSSTEETTELLTEKQEQSFFSSMNKKALYFSIFGVILVIIGLLVVMYVIGYTNAKSKEIDEEDKEQEKE